jgi:hypothetical protein
MLCTAVLPPLPTKFIYDAKPLVIRQRRTLLIELATSLPLMHPKCRTIINVKNPKAYSDIAEQLNRLGGDLNVMFNA